MTIGGREICLWWLVLLACGFFSLAEKAYAQDDVADVPSNSLFAGRDKNKHYFLIGADTQAKTPKDGFGLVVVLPGGDGGADFNPFVKRIYKHALSKKYLVAQLVAIKWTPRQQIVWPTKRAKVAKQKFSTEEFVEAVVKDITAKYKLNPKRIFTLSWSSGGPAAYAISLQKETSVTGSYIAMSVFKPDSLRSLEQAAGHGYFIYHSPDDKVCPFRMAENAYKTLRKHGAKAKMVTYKGGHGWRGNVYGRIRQGIQWLEMNHAQPKQLDQPGPVAEPNSPAAKPDSLEIIPLVGAGPVRFGMSKEEVIRHLGKPEKIFEGKDISLNYVASKGLSLKIDRRSGVRKIDCWSKSKEHPLPFPVRNFAGKTKEGIGVGASYDTIVAAFGKPDRTDSDKRFIKLHYDKLYTQFVLVQNRLLYINMHAPK